MKYKKSVIILFIFCFIVASCEFYLRITTRHEQLNVKRSSNIQIRKFPYPYKAALSINSDLDGTHSLKEFLTIQEYLCTHNETIIGKGLALEIGNSFFPLAEKDEFSLLSGDPADKEVILDLIHAGYIDFIHSYNTAENRDQIEGIIDSLIKNTCNLHVWVNHSSSPSNIGYLKGFFGDDENNEIYHSDISIDSLDLIFLWHHAVTGIVGQDRSLSLVSFFDAFDPKNPSYSFYNYTIKEIVKYLSSVYGNRQYKMRKSNDLVTVTHLDDGQPIFEFIRSNFGFRGVWDSANSNGLGHSLRKSILKKLIEVEGYSIIYTHLGENDGFPYISQSTQKALKYLEEQYRNGNIWVTTTYKLLNYNVNIKYLHWKTHVENDSLKIIIEKIIDPVRGEYIPTVEDLRGITFFTKNPDKASIYIQNTKIKEVTKNDADQNFKKSIMITLKPLPRIDLKMKEYKSKGYF